MRRLLAFLAATALGLAGLTTTPAQAEGPNLALGKQMSESSHTDVYAAAKANDGDQATYWESANNAFPQWIQVDLGSAVQVDSLTLKLPNGWPSRTQTLSVQGSADGTSFSTVVAQATYTFQPAATVTFATTSTRYLRLTITANTGWPAGQLAELEVYGPAGADTQPPTAPGNLAFTEPAPGQIRLTWQPSSDNIGVTGYEIYANNALRATVGGNIGAYTDSQPPTATLTYHVLAKDAANNRSPSSNTVTRQGEGGGTNLAQGKPISASGHTWIYTPANANDGNLATYWEGGGGYPNTLTVDLGANADVTAIVLKLSPDQVWGPRTQTLQVLGREQSATTFTVRKATAAYSFNPNSGNTVTIPVSTRMAAVRLEFTANTGAPNGQVAEFQVIGTPAPNPDLTITGMSVQPGSPVEGDAITLSATVKNAGTEAAAATVVGFYLGTDKAGTATAPGLAAGATQTVSANLGTKPAGTYPLSAKVDENNTVIEQNEGNNTYNHPNPLTVRPVDSSDLVAAPVGWTPGNPSAGDTVTFTVAIRNQGNVASAGGAHDVTLTVADESGTVVRTLTGSSSGVIAPGATAPTITLGTWAAANGKYTVKTVLAPDANELPVKRANNTSAQPLFVGRGANLPYDMYEAEDGLSGGGAQVTGPNRTIGDLAGEASGRRAVLLNTTGAFVEFTTKAPANTLVTRFSIPDGTTSTLNVYVGGAFLKSISLTSKYAWLYGAEASPSNSPGSGPPRHVYDEANMLLGTTVPAGSKIKLQKDAANSGTFAIDFINLEQATPQANPDPARYAVPQGFTHQDVQNALDRARQDPALTGVYLPAGDYPTAQKFQVYGKAVKVTGAGPWFTRFLSPSGQENTDVGFRVESSANGSSFSGFASFGNYVIRNDGPGKVWDLNGVSNVTIDNVWVEHQMCMLWGTNVHDMLVTNSRVRDTFADAINLTNGSTDNTVRNVEARSTGDDSFALFAAVDINNADQTGNVYENLTSTLTWRAAGVAVYGGQDNVFRNIYIADTLVYSGITISSLDFGIPMRGFGTTPTRFENISIVRAGGHFWGNQTFPGIWVFSASKVFQGIRVSDVDIVDPTYSGIMFQTQYLGGRPVNPITDTVFTDVSITGARKSGDAFDAKSGFGLWANELPEPDQGPAVGSVRFNGLRLSGNHTDIRNTTSTFTINVG
ncbi:discoidin domain-containing protein [Nonomuraea typhae]|uniref:discoidin domain-containing protein n=1 Tax=Nonomuraea typhae TaxID=2603600 RepID=UPI0012FC8B49|nr:discoidin domain-containing protein [Nonomuraea typhae]